MPVYILFAIDLVVEILAGHFGADGIQAAAKAILVPILSLAIVFGESHENRVRSAAVIALGFSWVGDILLIFAHGSPRFFLAGLGAFLLAHIAFAICFILIRRGYGISGRPPFLAIAATGAYATGMFALIAPYAAAMAAPVAAYAVVIGCMLIAAISASDRRAAPGGMICVAGAICFLVSDSILGINRFAIPIPYAHALVMLTYGAAQVLLVEGIARTLDAGKEQAV